MSDEVIQVSKNVWEKHKNDTIDNLLSLKAKIDTLPSTNAVYVSSMKNYFNGKLRQLIEDICIIEKAQFQATEQFYKVLGLEYYPNN